MEVWGGGGLGGACQSNLGQCLHYMNEKSTSREQRTKGGEEVNISHLGGIHYYCQHPLVMRRERKEKRGTTSYKREKSDMRATGTCLYYHIMEK